MYVLSSSGSRALIVGQAPAKLDDPTRPITGKTGRRLAGYMGFFEDEQDLFEGAFDRANLLDCYPGKQGKGDAFPREEAQRGAISLYIDRLGPVSCKYDWLLLLGRNVARCFAQQLKPWMEWETWMPQGLRVAVFPHPSGVNRWWNEEANRVAASMFLRDWRREIHERQWAEASVLDRGATRQGG
jgi:uracil-DNA glycosylase